MRSLTTAAVGSAVFFVVAPGIVAGLVPWLISGWDVRCPFGCGSVMALAFSVVRGDPTWVLIRNYLLYPLVAVKVGVLLLSRSPSDRTAGGRGDYGFVRNPCTYR